MSATVRTRSRGAKSRRSKLYLHKPSGTLERRVQAVGPERFGIVSVDCAKLRSRWMLCDFYGQILLPPATVEHTAPGFRQAVDALRCAVTKHQLGDVLVAVERTGNYHRPAQRAFRDAGYETRVVHPFAVHQFREVEHPGLKTDDNDLAGIHRATIVGFGLLEPSLDDVSTRLRLLVRHRRDLVQKATALQCQIREQLQATLPGFAALFQNDRFWQSPAAMPLARRLGTPGEILQLGAAGVTQLLKDAGFRFQQRTIHKVLAWAEQAAPPEVDALLHQRVLSDLDDDRLGKKRLIQALELDLAGLLVRTPYVLLLAIPAINVVSAAELAGEAGPITHYANPNALTGRAGLFPSRYQSDEVDRRGKLVRGANRRLRAALLLIADNLVSVNHYFHAQAALWKAREVDPRLQRVRVAKRFTRLAYAMLAGRQIVSHPCCREPHYILDKLLTFHLEHDASSAQTREHLEAAAQQLPGAAYAREAQALARTADKLDHARQPHLQSLGSLVKEVLAKRLNLTVQSPVEV